MLSRLIFLVVSFTLLAAICPQHQYITSNHNNNPSSSRYLKRNLLFIRRTTQRDTIKPTDNHTPTNQHTTTTTTDIIQHHLNATTIDLHLDTTTDRLHHQFNTTIQVHLVEVTDHHPSAIDQPQDLDFALLLSTAATEAIMTTTEVVVDITAVISSFPQRPTSRSFFI